MAVVIVTNLREFLLVGRGNHGEATQLDSFCIAADEGSFWLCTTHHVKTAKDIGARLREFLVRVMLLNAPLSEPEDLAWFLASYARDAKANVEKTELPALSEVRSALEETLGMKFTGPKGEHFFRSTLVQTIFYGIFSAWVLWCRSGIPDSQVANFDWKQAQWIINVPFIHTLFENLMMPGRLKPLGLVEILDRANSVLNRVDRTVFFGKFQEEHAVQYFYEPFLEAFDPELRKDLGVWYTPREIVQYQVARVDAVLRKEMGLADGLADPSVLVLDPCCGTGTYLIEVLAHIASTLNAKGAPILTSVIGQLLQLAFPQVRPIPLLPPLSAQSATSSLSGISFFPSSPPLAKLHCKLGRVPVVPTVTHPVSCQYRNPVGTASHGGSEVVLYLDGSTLLLPFTSTILCADELFFLVSPMTG